MSDVVADGAREEERLARAIRKARGFDADTLYQHLGDDYPIDFTDSEGRTFYKSWRKELPSVRAVLAALRSAPVKAEIKPHRYIPDYEAANGDCAVCGHGSMRTWHSRPSE